MGPAVNQPSSSNRPSHADAIIIGAGPAGSSCAAWLARLGFSARVLEASDAVGGLCRRNPFRDDWNVSLPGLTGAQVAENLAVSLREAGVHVQLSCFVRTIERGPSGFHVLADPAGQVFTAPYIVIASGVRPRGLGLSQPCVVPVLEGPGDHIASYDFHGKRVAVLGGGDNAFENALYALDRGAASVRVFARHVRAQAQFVRRMPPDNVSCGSYRVDPENGRVNGEPFDVVLVFYGWEPYAGFADALALTPTEHGFIATDPATAQTSCPGVYAIGEVASRQHPCVVTAMADGVTAAKAIQACLEAPLRACLTRA